jgi:hypothetical protein
MIGWNATRIHTSHIPKAKPYKTNFYLTLFFTLRLVDGFELLLGQSTIVHTILVKGGWLVSSVHRTMIGEIAVSNSLLPVLDRSRAHLLTVKIESVFFTVGGGNMEPCARLGKLLGRCVSGWTNTATPFRLHVGGAGST